MVQCDLNLAGDKLVRGCQPLYREGVCCNTEWVCPEEAEVIKGVFLVTFTFYIDNTVLPILSFIFSKMYDL